MNAVRTSRRYRWLCVFLGAAVLPAVASDPFDDGTYTFEEFDPSLVKQWKEEAGPLPPYPQQDDLVEVNLSPRTRVKVSVDPASVSVGDDRVVRLAYQVETGGGGRNVFYDGFRCATRTYKTYAIGTVKGNWRSLPDARWQDIPNVTLNPFRADLYNYYFCNADTTVRSRRRIVSSIKYGD